MFDSLVNLFRDEDKIVYILIFSFLDDSLMVGEISD
jgi:hypothetical protein